MKTLQDWEAELLGSSHRTAAILQPYLSETSTFFDIGGNVGQVTEILLQSVPRLSVSLFEPVPYLFAYCQQKFSPSSVQLYPFGFSDKAGCATIAINDDNWGLNSLCFHMKTFPGMRFEHIALLPMDSLDIAAVDLVKIDTEGWEGHILLGGKETIARCQPMIFMEVWEPTEAYTAKGLDFLSSLGYHCEGIYGADWLMLPARMV